MKQPSEEKFETHPITKEQAVQLIEAAKGTSLETLIPLALATAMRGGEIVGLKWEDIDFEEKTLYIQRTAYRYPKKGTVVAEPKTESSKSKIILPQFAIDALLLQRERQEQLRMKAGATWQELGLVFTNTHGQYMLQQYHLGKRFKKVLKKAGLPNMRFHDLRHSSATILIEMGVHVKQIQQLLRHSSITTTMNKYGHVLPSMERKVMDDLDNAFKRE